MAYNISIDGEKLKYLRRSKGYTQGKLADITGLTVITICNLERGKRQAHHSTVMMLADALGVKPYEIILRR